MEFIVKPVGPLQANAYILFEPDRDDALIIDPGGDPEILRAMLDGRRLSGILLTHGHFDHIAAVAALRGPDTPVSIHRDDAPMLTDPALSLAHMMNAGSQGEADALLADGQEVTIAGVPLTVLHTPGHTPGGVCYRCGDDLFTGDTIFRRGYGRTDFPGGDMRSLGASLRRLLALGDHIRLHPGHGAATTIGAERKEYSL